MYQAALQNLGPLQSHCDAVGEDEDQHHVVKELMGYDGLAHLAEPAGGGDQNIGEQKETTRRGQDSQTVYGGGGILVQPLFTSFLIKTNCINGTL